MPYMAQLDGVRGIAILLVVLGHFGGITVAAGEMGVRLFFVLSGFLITGVLLGCRRARERTGQSLAFTLRQFYVRRALRIFPVFYAALAVAVAVEGREISRDIWYHAFYGTNLWVALKLRWPPGIAHLWSLCVEEQFYLVWPLVILLVPRRWLAGVVACVALAGPAFRIAGMYAWRDVPHADYRIYVATPSYLDALGLGALLAVAREQTRARPWVSDLIERGGFWLGIGTAVPVAVAVLLGGIPYVARTVARWHLLAPGAPSYTSWLWTVLGASSMTLLCAWLVAGATRRFGGDLGSVLELRTLGYVGRVSYGMYVWHGYAVLPLGCWLASHGQVLSQPLALFVLTAMTLMAATVSWYALERPLNGLKRFFPYARA